MLSDEHQHLLRELSQNNIAYDNLKQLVEDIVVEHTQQLQDERDLAYDYINQVATALLSLDKHGHITLVNHSLCHLTGYSYDELMGHDWFDLCLPHNEREKEKCIFREIVTGKREASPYYENYIVTKTGERKLIAWQNIYQTDPETGEIIGSFSSGEDITDIKHSEQILQETQEQLNAILDGVVDGVAVIGADERLLYANDAAANMLGFASVQDMMEAMKDGLYILNETLDEEGNFLEFHEQALYFALQGETPPPQTVIFYDPNTDTEIWADTKARPILDEQGRLRFAVIILNNMTRTRQIEKVKFELLQEQAQIDTLREFIAKTTHDLSQPLSVINTAVYMLDKSVPNELVQKRTATIRTQSLQMQAILRDIQQMSTLDTMKKINMGRIDPKPFMNQIADYGKSLADEKHINFIYTANFTGESLWGHEAYLDRAIIQILQNALSYTPEGGEVRLNYIEQAHDVVIEIQDTGIGIGDEHIKHIFDRFYRADKSRTPETGSGSGLGLAIAKRVMELHHGQIEVESVLDKGSIFRIYLPIQSPQA